MPDWNWGGAGQGAVAGGTTGAAFGPWGAAIGAGIGGITGGLFGGGGDDGRKLTKEDRMRALAFYEQLGQGQAAQAGPASLAEQSAFRSNQRDLVGRLEALSRGEGPSLAQEQLRAATDRASNQQYAMAAGARGNPALAARNAANQAGSLQSQAAGQAAMARAAEQLGALQQLGGVTGQARMMDEGLSQYNAGQQNQVGMFNANQANQFSGTNNALRLQALSQSSGLGTQLGQMPTQIERLQAGAQGLIEELARKEEQDRQRAQQNPYAPYASGFAAQRQVA